MGVGETRARESMQAWETSEGADEGLFVRERMTATQAPPTGCSSRSGLIDNAPVGTHRCIEAGVQCLPYQRMADRDFLDVRDVG